MAGKRADLMATDPPYLVDYTGRPHPASKANGGAPAKDKHWDTYIDHEHSVAFYVDFLKVALDHALATMPPSTSGSASCAPRSLAELEEVGLLPHQVLIWKKTRAC